jgi:hypothetical protein
MDDGLKTEGMAAAKIALPLDRVSLKIHSRQAA